MLQMRKRRQNNSLSDYCPRQRQIYVVLGNPKYHLDDLRLDAKENQPTIWTINKNARAGDEVLFYFVRPQSAILAKGKLLKDAYLDDDPNSDWYGFFLGEIGGLEFLNVPVAIQMLRSEFASWRWLKSPIKSSKVPEDCAGDLLRIIKEAEWEYQPE